MKGLDAQMALIGVAAVLILGLPTGFCAPMETGPGTGLRFRRVYAPADRLSDWPKGKSRYIPVEPAEFERLLKEGQASAADDRAPATTRLLKAEYKAQLIGDQMAAGEAVFEVAHGTDHSALLPLEPFSLAIGKATWSGEPAAKAVLGSAQDSPLLALVERPGVLRLEWTLVGRRDSSDALNFTLDLPSCPINRFVLELPETMTPATDQGIVTAPAPPENGTRRWKIELGGNHRFTLRIVSSGAAEPRRALALVRESSVYDFSFRGIEFSTEWKLDVHHEPLKQVTMSLDPRLQLVSAQVGDAPIAWSVTSPGTGPATRILLPLPAPIHGPGHVLRLKAVAPLELDRSSRLPRIRSEGLFWQEGTATLLVPTPLLMEHVKTTGCRQSGMGPLSAPRTGEAVHFQYFAPDAALDAVITLRQPPVQLVSGTSIELGPEAIKARIAADLRVVDASRFTLSADLAPHWRIDSIESIPPGAVEDWTVEKSGGEQRLQLHLAKALAPSRPLRLLVSAGRLPASSGKALGVADLVPLRLAAPGEMKRLISLRSSGACLLRMTGIESLHRRDPRSLTADEKSLLNEPPGVLLFEDSPAASALEVTVEAQRPAFAATIQVEAAARDSTLQESYVLRCVPESTRIERILVHLWPGHSTPVRWTLGTEGHQQLAARRWTAAEQKAAGEDGQHETWELALRRPRSAPLEIHGTREVPTASSPQAISLAALPEASSQRATLVVRSLATRPLRVVPAHLRPVPSDTVAPSQYPSALGTYRYDPPRDGSSWEPGASIAAAEGPATASIWIWDCEAESRYQVDGAASHTVVYRLQCAAPGRLHLTLPPGVGLEDVRGAWFGGGPAVWQPAESGSSAPAALVIDLPPGEKFPVVTLHFVTQTQRLGILGSLQPLLPTTDLPVFWQQWTVWLPPGYEALEAPAWPGNWSRRMLGVLGRDTRESPFNPFSARDWLQPGVDRRAGKLEKLCRQWLEQLGMQATEDAQTPSSQGTWAGLLDQRVVQSPCGPLLVDRRAAARLGLTPQTPVRLAHSGNQPLDMGLALLRSAGLAVLASTEALALTSEEEVLSYRPWLVPLEHPMCWQVRSGPLAERVRQAAAGQSDPVFVAADIWKQEPPEAITLWARAGSAKHGMMDLRGWAVGSRRAAGAPPGPIAFVHRSTTLLLGSVVFLVFVALGWRKAADHPAALVWLLGVSALAALLVRQPFAPLFAGAVLGTLFCMGLALVYRHRSPSPDAIAPRPDDVPSTVSAMVLPAVWIAVSLAALRAAAAAHAGPPSGNSVPPPLPAATRAAGTAALRDAGGNPLSTAAPAARRPPSTVYQVFVPVDGREQPTGGKYFVPEELFQQLHRRAASGAERLQGWLMTSATYRGLLAKESNSERLTVDRLVASFELQVFDRGAQVRVPLRRTESNLLPDGALLDGRPIEPEWDADGNALLVGVAEPGSYRLELALRPSLRGGTGPTGLDMAVPRLAASRLELLVPGVLRNLEVPCAVGPVRWEDDPSRLTAELGPTDRLVVRWQDGSASAGAGPAIDVDQLLWLKIQPGSVLLDAKFKLKIMEGQVRQWRLVTDPRLRLLPLEGPDAPSVSVRAVPNQPQEITLQWPRPLPESAALSATFLVTGMSGVGNLRLPEIEAPDARLVRSWLALSVDPVLDHTVAPAAQAESLTVSDFLGGWGPAPTKPTLACRLPLGDANWNVSTRPRQPTTTAEQSLALSFGPAAAEAFFVASLETAAGYHFQYQVTAPPALEVQKVSLTENGVERAARWSRDRDGRLTVFLTEAVSGQQKLSIRGRLPLKSPRNVPLPWLQVDRVQIRVSTVELYRRESALVDISRTSGMAETEPSSSDGPRPDLGRLVRAFRVEKPPPAASLRVVPNRPTVRAEQITQLHTDEPSPTASIDLHLHVSGGVVDSLRIETPDRWTGPYEVTPDAALEVIDLPGDTHELIVQPRTAIDDGSQFRITGPLAVSPDESLSLPRIVLRGVDSLRQFVCLPGGSPGQTLVWRMRGLKAARLPEGVVGIEDSAAVYEVADASFQAVLKSAEQGGRLAGVRLADVHLAWDPDGFCRGVAAFDLKPSGLADCPLWLPAGYRLVQVSVGGAQAAAVPLGERTWQVPLGSTELPQRVEVVFTGRLPWGGGPGRQRLDAPALGDLPVERTLWTAVGPDELEPISEPAEAIGPVQQEMLRLKAIAGLIESVAATAGEDAQAVASWYHYWARRLVASRTTLDRLITRNCPDRQARAMRAELRAIDKDQSRLAARLGMINFLAQLYAEPPVADDPSELLHWSFPQGAPVLRYAMEGRPNALTVSYQAVGPRPRQDLLAAVAVLAVLIPLTVVGLRTRTLHAWFARWPAVFGVVAGLAWWLWLWPSVLGWAIIVVSLLAAARSGFRRPKTAPPSSVSSFPSLPHQAPL